MKNLVLKAILIVFLVGISNLIAEGQNLNADLALAFHSKVEKTTEAYKPKFLFVSEKKVLKYNPVSLAFGSLLYFYQGVVSPQISAECPYEVSCSNFGKASLKRYGLIKGLSLTAFRMMRCNRIAGSDIHPLYINEVGKIIDDPEQYKLK
jgi:putative component of membrane protein insertase Oxa1/YidC/SpoIIIJ protein YidD